jgi:sugar transferase EpsL
MGRSQNLKRCIDLVAAALMLVTCSPLLLVIAIAVKIKMGGSILFWQERTGKDKRSFRMCKFRTMAQLEDQSGTLLPDAQRLTPFGSWLRSASLDELPELINVLVGDMSLVGPRPLLPRYLPRYSAEQCRRHEVKPGMTGWAQVNGRNRLDWAERFEMDVWYVDNWSLSLDIKILLLTIRVMLQRNDVNKDGEATMSEFMGNS